MINKIDLRKAISSIAISNAKRNTIYRAFSDLDSITKEEFDSVKSDISKVVESMLTKDTVGKANGVASLDSNGSVPIEQLGNIDTTLFLIVRELPTNDIKSNKIYLVPNQNGQGDNVYFEYLYVESVWEKLGEFKPEVDLSHIEAKLDTKADITDVNNRLDDLQNYCFELGNDGKVTTPYIMPYSELDILRLNNNKEYTYANIGGELINDDGYYIYDKTLNKTIKITKISNDFISANADGDFFRTSEPLNLSHTFYLDNEKTGVVENLTQLTIEESNVFLNLPYVETNDNLDDGITPQYIYDATDNKWIEVVETYYAITYAGFNTEESLDLTHDLYYSYYPNIIGNWTTAGRCSTSMGFQSLADDDGCTAIGYKSLSGGDNSIAIGKGATTHSNWAICLGCDSETVGSDSIVIGRNTITNNENTIFIGNEIKTDKKTTNSIAIGGNTRINAEDSIAIGRYATSESGVAIGYSSNAWRAEATAIGNATKAFFVFSTAIGAYAETGGNYAIAIGNNVPNTKSIFGVGFNGVNGIDMDRDNYGLYLKGFGGYDGTNLVVKSGDTETLNPDIKSVQQIINEKADSSAIPTKVSQLTNDANFITSYTETDPVWTREKTKYYTKTEIDNKGYLTAHQSLDDYAEKKELDNVKNDIQTYVDSTLENYAMLQDVSLMLSAKADLVDDKLKAEQLPKLFNITAAATTEEVVTKFNALLAHLKAKGYMEADTAK